MKKMMNVTGARQLSKNEQKSVTGGQLNPKCSDACYYIGQVCFYQNFCGGEGRCAWRANINALDCIPW